MKHINITKRNKGESHHFRDWLSLRRHSATSPRSCFNCCFKILLWHRSCSSSLKSHLPCMLQLHLNGINAPSAFALLQTFPLPIAERGLSVQRTAMVGPFITWWLKATQMCCYWVTSTRIHTFIFTPRRLIILSGLLSLVDGLLHNEAMPFLRSKLVLLRIEGIQVRGPDAGTTGISGYGAPAS